MNFNNVIPNEDPEIRRRKTHSCAKQNRNSIPGSKYYHEYKIWNNFMGRCYNPDLPAYKWYGAEGIRVCDEWKNFSVFLDWLIEQGYKPNTGMSIERVNENDGYNPYNCILVDASINTAFKGNTAHYIINNHYLVSYCDLKDMYSEYRRYIDEYHLAGLDESIPDLLKELGCEDDIKFVTKEDMYKKLELI